MAIIFTNIDSSRPLKGSRMMKTWIKAVISKFGKQTGDITIALCSDSYMREQNNQFLSHDYFTDILTFEYNEGDFISGDLLISSDTLFSNAKIFGVTYQEELHRVVIHGVLHLLGINDQSDEERKNMQKNENECLEILKQLKASL